MRDLEHDIARMEGEGPVPQPAERKGAFGLKLDPAGPTDRALGRFEDDGGPAAPEPDEGVRDALPEVPAIFGLKAEALPLAPPPSPTILADTTVRIALIRADDPLHPVAMEVDFTGEDAIMANAALIPDARMEITLTNGFNRTRTLQLSPAEFMLVVMYGDRFFAELPR